MAEYGYAYRSFFTYSTGTVRNETREPVVKKPFVPSVPKSNGNNVSEGHVTRKTIVPVTSRRPYDDSATEKYPSRGDDDNQWHRQTSPVRGSPRKVDHEFPSPTKVQNEANRPQTQRFSPVANSTGWRHTPQPTPYSDDDDDHYYNNNNKKEGYKPTSLPIRKNDGYNNNNGYGIGNGNNKEQRRPFGSTTRNNNYDDDDSDHDYVNYNNREGQNMSKPKISSDWTKAPRKGTQLSEPTHDIEKALELLKMEAAKREHGNSNKYDNWAAPAPGNGSRFADLTRSKFDKGTGSPHSPSSMPMEPASPNKSNYGSETDDHDRKGGMRTFANFNLSSRPRRPQTRVAITDGRDDAGDIMDSREAEKKFKGTRVW